MASRVERPVVLGALLALGHGLSVPVVAEAQGTADASDASCSSFSQALLSRAYGTTPWQIAPVEQVASAAFQQAVTSSVLEALFTQYGNELGALQEQQAPTASVSTELNGDGTATICTYQANGIFQQGTGTVGLVLVRSGGDWLVLRVRMHDLEHGSS
jgi:hypothetical protein